MTIPNSILPSACDLLHSGLLVQVSVNERNPPNIEWEKGMERSGHNPTSLPEFLLHPRPAARFPSIMVSRLESRRRQLVFFSLTKPARTAVFQSTSVSTRTAVPNLANSQGSLHEASLVYFSEHF